jgi:hypothetical protein
MEDKKKKINHHCLVLSQVSIVINNMQNVDTQRIPAAQEHIKI